ncbi:hypothetical protein ABKV19_014399 [Rosa sericea]
MENGYDVAGNHIGREIKVADLIWVETNGGSWWPAQVVNENAVSGNNKPLKTSSGEVPVRLYGSYKFLYVDPQKCSSDFEIILEQNNGSYREIFLKALEQVLFFDEILLLLGRSKKQGFKSKVDASRNPSDANHAVEDPKIEDSNFARIRSSPRLQKQGKKVEDKANGKPIKQDGLLKNAKENGSSVQAEVLTEAGARRLRVMQNLGLIAPSGSPYHKNGRV